jgi:Ran GTPase-activating protein (RanGAP) involved in mRNA processing and transport
MSTTNENLYINSYIESTGQVELTVDFNSISNPGKKKSCSINKTIGKSCTVNKSNSINKIIESKAQENDLKEKNLTEAEVILDKTTQSQLTPKFIKSTSTSEWANLIKQVEQVYSYPSIELFDMVLAKELAKKFVEGLEKDFMLLKSDPDSYISDCGLFAPRSRSTYNNPTHPLRFVNEIVNLMYVEPKRVTEFENGKVMYTKLISRLSKKYVEQYTKEFLSNNKYKLFRLLEHDRKNWDYLKNKPLASVVTNPTAMPVEVAPLEELEPFFKFLDSNAIPIDNNNEYEPCMKFVRGALYQDKRMDLCKQVVGPTWIEMLMGSLVSNTQVEHFLLGNNIIGPIGGKAIGQFLLQTHKPKIKTWYVAGNDLDAEGIEWICRGLKSDTDCVNLWLKRNPLKPEGIAHVAELLKTNTYIKILDLHNTAAFDEGTGYLMEGLKSNRTLRHLYLDANGITKHGIKYVCEYFNYLVQNDLEGISSLWIDMNNIGDEGIIELVEILGKYKYLKRLNLGSIGLTEKSIDTIVKAFSQHTGLIALDLGMYKSTSDMGMITNNIGDEGMYSLSDLIKSNKSIQYLNVMMNGLTVKGIEYLYEAIQQSNTIMYIDFAQYGIDIPQKIYSGIKVKVESNRVNTGYTRKLRNLKHGEQIHWIDSIYRNNMK